MRELQPGLWHWQAAHPDWSAAEPWDEEVSPYAVDDGDRVLLFDPLAVPDEIAALAAHWYLGGDRLPLEVEALAGREHDAVIFHGGLP